MNFGLVTTCVLKPKIDILEDHISASRGRCASKFLRALENDQILLVHTLPEMGVPLTKFFKWGQKLA